MGRQQGKASGSKGGKSATHERRAALQARVQQTPQLAQFLRHLGMISVDLDDEEIEIQATLPDESFAFGSANYEISRTIDLEDHEPLRAAVHQLVAAVQDALAEADEEYDPNRCDRCVKADCCGIGRIHLTEEERLRILEHLGEPDTREASAKYFEEDDDLAGFYSHIMRHSDEEHCVLLQPGPDGIKRCSIYEVRPNVCREYDAGYCTEATELRPRRSALEV